MALRCLREPLLRYNSLFVDAVSLSQATVPYFIGIRITLPSQCTGSQTTMRHALPRPTLIGERPLRRAVQASRLNRKKISPLVPRSWQVGQSIDILPGRPLRAKGTPVTRLLRQRDIFNTWSIALLCVLLYDALWMKTNSYCLDAPSRFTCNTIDLSLSDLLVPLYLCYALSAVSCLASS